MTHCLEPIGTMVLKLEKVFKTKSGLRFTILINSYAFSLVFHLDRKFCLLLKNSTVGNSTLNRRHLQVHSTFLAIKVNPMVCSIGRFQSGISGRLFGTYPVRPNFGYTSRNQDNLLILIKLWMLFWMYNYKTDWYMNTLDYPVASLWVEVYMNLGFLFYF